MLSHEKRPPIEGESPSEAPPVADLVDRLVLRAREGDMQAWSRLYQQHFDMLFRHVRFMTGDSNLAEDLTQEAFAQALVSLARFRGEAKFSTWLHRVAINVVRKHWRWQRNTETAHERYEALGRLREAGNDPDRQTQQRARARALYSVLERMPDGLREVFVLRDLEALSQREIAVRLEISENNVAVRATRARAHVRRELEQLGWLAGVERR